jgi:hypothetical protein
MSESTIQAEVRFTEVSEATAVEQILLTASKKSMEAFSAGEELPLHLYLASINETRGIWFDSWWLVQSVVRDGSSLEIELVGSPSGTDEQDFVTWIKHYGATEVVGEMVVDGGGDVMVMKL